MPLTAIPLPASARIEAAVPVPVTLSSGLPPGFPLSIVWASTVFVTPRLKTPPMPEPASAVVVVRIRAAAAAPSRGRLSL